jgi:hypothetical protein
LSLALDEAFKNVNGIIDLFEKIISVEVPIAVFASLKDDPGFPSGCKNVWVCEMMGRRGLTHPHHAVTPNLMSGSLTPLMTGHCPWPLVSTC